MTKNIKRMFFVLTLVTLLATVGAVCAADDTNSTAVTDNSVSDVATVSDSASDTIAAEPATTSDDNKVDAKTIEKEDKNIKKDPVTIDGVTYTNVIENQVINEYTTLNEKSYINNLNITVEGDYGLDVLADSYINNSNINAYLYNEKLLSINNSYITHESQNFKGDLRIYNSVISDNFLNTGVMTLNNTTILSVINSNNANLYISNSILNSTIKINGGNITIDEKTILGENFSLENTNGNIYTNNSEYLALSEKEGIYYLNKTLENININSNITNNANMQIINCNITAKITNNGNITFVNCSFSNNNMNIPISGIGNTGFLLYNLGNASLIDCVMENNQLNFSSYSMSTDSLGGAFYNNGILNITNSFFKNNTVGFVDSSRTYQFGTGSCIVNHARLYIDSCVFEDNWAANAGGAIYTGSWTNINNSVFNYNFAGINGGAVYIRGNYSITNSNFTNNNIDNNIDGSSAPGGLKPSGGALYIIYAEGTIDNCEFKNNNIGTKYGDINYNRFAGGAIRINNGINNIINSKFINNTAEQAAALYISDNDYSTYSTITTINNCTFEDNYVESINGNYTSIIVRNTGSLNILNSVFKNNYNATNLIYSSGDLQTQIINNKFINNSMTLNTICSDSSTSYTITNNEYDNTTINDVVTLNVPNKIYTGEPITITGTYYIQNSSFYDPKIGTYQSLNTTSYDQDILEQNKFNIYINGVLDQTIDELEFTVTPTAGTMMVTVQPTISQTRKTQPIRATTLTDITITPENYNEYIYEGVLVGVGQNSKITFQGEFTDKSEIYIDTSNIILDGINATFTNTKFTLDAENITIQNMNINNTNMNYPIANYQDNNIITNNTITLTNTNTHATAIYNQASNTIISNNTLTVEALAGGIDWDNSEGGVADTQAILLLGRNNNTIQNNTINIKSTQATGYNTLEAITNNNNATNTHITQNKINISGANFNYAIDSINNVENITITENTITVTGERYCDGIQTGNNAKNIVVDNNNITCICINTTELTSEGAITYGVIGTMLGGHGVNNMTITNNNINLTGTANYGIELYWVDTTEIHNNNITVNGPFSMGIGYGYSPNGNATGNTITTTGDSTTPINQITEEFKPENVGIRIQNGTSNISITDNTITTSDVGGQDTTIHSEPDNVTIANNQLTSSQGYGDDTIKAPTTATIENNTIETTTTIEVPGTIITNTPTTITANVTTIDGTPINGGTITFTQGNEAITQAEVIDGVATTTVTFKEAEDTTIVASYTPESSGLSTSSAEAATSIQAPQTQLNIEDVELTAGETVTLTATVTDQAGNTITGGKVIFKVNGKTVKDASGKVIYAKVVDGIATVEYIVPDNLSGKDVNITAVYSGSSKYNKESTTITKTVAAQEPTLTITPITDDVQTGSTVTLKAKVAAGDKAITTGKIVFKINGKTVKDANGKVIYAKVDANGEVSVDYNLGNLKAGTYTLEATFISPNYDKITSNTTMTVVKA